MISFLAALSVFFNSLPKGEYSNLFTVAAFSATCFLGKTSVPVKSWYLLTSPDGKAEILAVYLSKSYELCFARFCYWLLWFSH